MKADWRISVKENRRNEDVKIVLLEAPRLKWGRE
jgi:hypothetical protein